jgi:hypothetical protein
MAIKPSRFVPGRIWSDVIDEYFGGEPKQTAAQPAAMAGPTPVPTPTQTPEMTFEELANIMRRTGLQPNIPGTAEYEQALLRQGFPTSTPTPSPTSTPGAAGRAYQAALGALLGARPSPTPTVTPRYF